jgi:hypothetical protein
MKKTSQYIILFTSITTFGIGLYPLSWPYTIAAISFLLWAVSPYVLLATLVNLVSSKTAIMFAFVITIVTCIFGLATIIDALYIHIDAQGALAIMAVPLWQWAGLLILSLPLTLLNIAKR